jgi:hypothetical protein
MAPQDTKDGADRNRKYVVASRGITSPPAGGLRGGVLFSVQALRRSALGQSRRSSSRQPAATATSTGEERSGGSAAASSTKKGFLHVASFVSRHPHAVDRSTHFLRWDHSNQPVRLADD